MTWGLLWELGDGEIFLEPALSLPQKVKLQSLSFKIQTMCGMSVWMKRQVNAFVGRQGERGRKILEESDFVGEILRF